MSFATIRSLRIYLEQKKDDTEMVSLFLTTRLSPLNHPPPDPLTLRSDPPWSILKLYLFQNLSYIIWSEWAEKKKKIGLKIAISGGLYGFFGQKFFSGPAPADDDAPLRS